jgi:hippurate hydrolase
MLRASTGLAESPGDWFAEHESRWVGLYKWFHAHPEQSFEERATAARYAEVLRELGAEVQTGVGGHGVAAVLDNGDGPTVMLRADLDALPLRERTDLPFASTQTTENAEGSEVGLMHACGHDLHMTNVLAVTSYLASHRDRWSGRLVVIGQPAEERGAGALAMLRDGLFERRVPKPDYALALHVDSSTAAGTVQLAGGYVLANVDSVDITVKGRGGHGSAPHTTIDPIAQAASLVLSLQQIVSREVDPTEPAVVTVGAIRGGTKHNIIPSECHLQITVRSYTDEVREQVLAAIDRRARGVAAAHGAPEPEIKVSEGTPALSNDRELAERIRGVFDRVLGSERVQVAEPSMGGEDFSQFGRAGVPILMYRLGAVRQDKLDRFEQLGISPPSLHSPTFYPDLDPALRTGFLTMTAAALELLRKK